MGHALVTSVFGLWRRAFLSRPGRKRKLSRRYQGHGGVVSAQRARARDRNLQLRRRRRRNSRAVHRARGGGALRMARFLPGHRRFQRDMDRLVVDSLSKPGELLNRNQFEAVTPPVPAIRVVAALRYRQAWAFVVGKFLTDPVWWFYLFWLPRIFQFSIQARPLAHRAAAHRGLRRFDHRQRLWRLAAQGIYALRACRLKSARLAAMLTCACCSADRDLQAVCIRSGLRSRCCAWPPAHTRAGRPISSPRLRICFPPNMWEQWSVSGRLAGAVGGAIFALVAGHISAVHAQLFPLFVILAPRT